MRIFLCLALALFLPALTLFPPLALIIGVMAFYGFGSWLLAELCRPSDDG